jgi:hypothetical protein
MSSPSNSNNVVSTRLAAAVGSESQKCSAAASFFIICRCYLLVVATQVVDALLSTDAVS